VQHVFPVFTPPGVQDSHPLMKPPMPKPEKKPVRKVEVSDARGR
jgi:hypothetical protein